MCEKNKRQGKTVAPLENIPYRTFHENFNNILALKLV